MFLIPRRNFVAAFLHLLMDLRFYVRILPWNLACALLHHLKTWSDHVAYDLFPCAEKGLGDLLGVNFGMRYRDIKLKK
jgi:hypothetical protein